MLEVLEAISGDEILAIMAEFRNDPRPEKVDLSVGVYKNSQGLTPVMSAVSKAQGQLIEEEVSKTYIGPAGSALFNQLVTHLLLGENHSIVTNETFVTIQSTGGSGALRVAAELFRSLPKPPKIWLGNTTWPNHKPLLGSSGLDIELYPYFDFTNNRVDSEAMMDALTKVPSGDVVLVHGCCHNPSGADLSYDDWQKLASLALQQGFTVFVDMAYQGLGDGLNEDAVGVRLLAEQLPELVIAGSCAKNFGLYRERTGFLTVTVHQQDLLANIRSNLNLVTRKLYSMPPAHGALLVERVLSDSKLNQEWHEELNQMRSQIVDSRKQFNQRLNDYGAKGRFEFIEGQKGMFSFLGITSEQAQRLRKEFGVYVLDSGRVNLAGITKSNVDYCAKALTEVINAS